MRSLGTVLVAVGLGLVGLGLLFHFGALSWFGRLPGDFRFEGERTRVYFPVSSMVLLSLAVSLLLYLWRRVV